MKAIYVTSECCTSRKAEFASTEIKSNGDYYRWPYGIRESKLMARFGHPLQKQPNMAGKDIYLKRTAESVLNLLGKDY